MSATAPSFAVTVSPIRRDPSGEYHWRVTCTDPYPEPGDSGFLSKSFKTSTAGEGLWVRQASSTARALNPDGTTSAIFEWTQVRGTCQFNLAGVSASTRRERVLEACLPAEILHFARDGESHHVTAQEAYTAAPRVPDTVSSESAGVGSNWY